MISTAEAFEILGRHYPTGGFKRPQDAFTRRNIPRLCVGIGRDGSQADSVALVDFLSEKVGEGFMVSMVFVKEIPSASFWIFQVDGKTHPHHVAREFMDWENFKLPIGKPIWLP